MSNCVTIPIASAARRIAVLRPRPVLATAGAAVVKRRPRPLARACRDAGALAVAGTVPAATPAEAPGIPAVSSGNNPGPDGIAGPGGGPAQAPAQAPAPAPAPAQPMPAPLIQEALLFPYPGPSWTPPGTEQPGCCLVPAPEIPVPAPPVEVPAPALGATFLLATVILVALRRRRG